MLLVKNIEYTPTMHEIKQLYQTDAIYNMAEKGFIITNIGSPIVIEN